MSDARASYVAETSCDVGKIGRAAHWGLQRGLGRPAERTYRKGAASGLGLGAMIAASLSLVVVGLMVITILSGGGSNVANAISGSLVLGLCIPLVLLFVLLGVGFVIGRATD